MSEETLAFRCGMCRKRQRVAARYAGRRAMCPACGATFSIPSREQVDAALPERLAVYPSGEHSEASAQTRAVAMQAQESTSADPHTATAVVGQDEQAALSSQSDLVDVKFSAPSDSEQGGLDQPCDFDPETEVGEELERSATEELVGPEGDDFDSGPAGQDVESGEDDWDEEIVELSPYDVVLPDDGGEEERVFHEDLPLEGDGENLAGQAEEGVGLRDSVKSESILAADYRLEAGRGETGSEDALSEEELGARVEADSRRGQTDSDVIEISDGTESKVHRSSLTDAMRAAMDELDENGQFDASATSQTQVLDLSDEDHHLYDADDSEPQAPEQESDVQGSDLFGTDEDAEEEFDQEEDLEDDQVFFEDDVDDDSKILPGVGSTLEKLDPGELAQRIQDARRSGDTKASETTLAAALSRYEATGALLLERGHYRAMHDDLEGAVDDFVEARAQGFEDSVARRVIDRFELDELLDQADYFIKEEPQRAANLLRGIVAERPDYGRAVYCLGLALRATGQLDQARVAFEQAAQLGYEPEDRVDELAAGEEPEDGIDEQAAGEEPEDGIDELAAGEEPEDRVDKVDLSDELAAIEELLGVSSVHALTRAESVVREWPGEGYGHELLAEARLCERDVEGALEAYLRARELGRETHRLSCGVYHALLVLDQGARAAQEVTRHVSAESPDPFWLSVQLGRQVEEQNWLEAVECLVRLSRSAVGDPELRQSLGVSAASIDSLSALDGLRAAVRQEPENAFLCELLADLSARTGYVDQAIALYTELLDRSPGDRRLLFKRAACWQLKTPSEPRRALKDLGSAFDC